MTLKEEYQKYYKTGKCRCDTLSNKVVGDGCMICNPDYDHEMRELYIDQLEDATKKIAKALESLGSYYPDGQRCFCEMRSGNPMIKNHSKACIKAREILK
jgi:hypothetical protein